MMTRYFENWFDGIDWPLLESPGSAARRIIVHSTESEPHAWRSGTSVLDNQLCCRDDTCPLNVHVLCVIATRSVGHLGHCMLFSALKNPFDACILVNFLICAPTLPGEQSTTISAIERRSERPPLQRNLQGKGRIFSCASYVQYSG